MRPLILRIYRTFNETQASNLLIAAQLYSEMGWSVIPTAGKIAAVTWKAYQRRKPTSCAMAGWFSNPQESGLAIITGRVSGLAVLDFDDEALFKLFKVLHPYLADTRTVKTRRGYHLYYSVPDDLTLHSQHGKGIDLQYEGCYVIAPPSIVDGYEYKLVQGGKSRILTAFDVESLSAFWGQISNQAKSKLTAPKSRSKGHFRGSESHSRSRAKSEQSRALTGSDLAAIYRAIAPTEGRNNALFGMSCLGRDHGLSQKQIAEALVEVHVLQPGSSYESPYQRRSEAYRTIHSAFSRPPRPVRGTKSHSHGQLSNVIRERLLTLRMTHVIRVLDGLRICGVKPDDTFTALDAIEFLAGIVGKGSIRRALTAEIPFPSEPSLSKTSGAKEKGTSTPTQCLVGRVQKPKKSLPTHRPETIFVMPTNAKLANFLNVPDSQISDELTLNDLSSAKSTRMALHKAYIERRPGQYSISWLAKRLGLTRRSVQYYHAEDQEIRCRPLYTEHILSWSTLNEIPDELPHRGIFLEDDQGKRYPAILGLAKRLLSAAKKLILKRRLPSFFWIGEKPPQLHTRETQLRLQSHQRRFWKPPETVWMREPIENRRKDVPQKQGQKDIPNRHNSVERPQASSEAISLAAQKVFETLNSIGKDKISLERITQFIQQSGINTVERAVEIVQKRANVRNPAGLLVTILRGEKFNAPVS